MDTKKSNNINELAVFGGGCFWCTEAVFKILKGVISVEPGYSGGKIKNPTYEKICVGNTGHIEVIKIEYDPGTISFENLLTVFFGSHDPTTVNRQGNDIGEQYKSVIFYTNELQKDTALNLIKEINNSSKLGKPIVTEVEKFSEFYPAEDYHKNYFERNKNKPYCEFIINPKLDKVKEKFAQLLKENN